MWAFVLCKCTDKMPQTDKFEFADLNIVHKSDPAATLALVRRAIRLGYDTIAINIDVGDLNDVAANQVPYTNCILHFAPFEN